MFKKAESLRDLPEIKILAIWKKLWREEIDKIKPELIVCDFFTRVGAEIADDLGIPCVINAPCLFNFLVDYALAGVTKNEDKL